MDIETILKQDPNVEEILPSETWDFPNIDHTYWSEQNFIKERVETIKAILNSPYVLDDFGTNHEARREWRENKGKAFKEFKDYYDSNALRGNRRYALSLNVFLLPRFYEGSDIDQLIEKSQSFDNLVIRKDLYLPLSNQEKVKHVKNLKQEAYNIIKTLPTLNT